jgi:hypothetical protein
MHQLTAFCALIEVNARGELRSCWAVKGNIELTDVCGLWEDEPYSTTRDHSSHIVPVTACGDGTNSSVGAVAYKLKLESRGAIDPVANIYRIGGIWGSGDFLPNA